MAARKGKVGGDRHVGVGESLGILLRGLIDHPLQVFPLLDVLPYEYNLFHCDLSFLINWPQM